MNAKEIDKLTERQVIELLRLFTDDWLSIGDNSRHAYIATCSIVAELAAQNKPISSSLFESSESSSPERAEIARALIKLLIVSKLPIQIQSLLLKAYKRVTEPRAVVLAVAGSVILVTTVILAARIKEITISKKQFQIVFSPLPKEIGQAVRSIFEQFKIF